MGSVQSTAVRMGGRGVLSVDGQTAISQRKVGIRMTGWIVVKIVRWEYSITDCGKGIRVW